MTPLNPHSESAVFLCPGQGAQSPAMLPLIRSNASTAALLEHASDLLKEDLHAADTQDAAFFARNEISAVLVSLASIAAHAELGAQVTPDYIAGYSVGQWTAMHLAGMLPAETLIALLIQRARLMNQTRAVQEGAMLAVIGIPRAQVEEVIATISSYLIIANDNAPAQFTLSGELAAIAEAENKLAELKPQRLLRVPVAGAWHSQMVANAVAPFREYLQTIHLATPTIPVISNVTAQSLPADSVQLRDELAAHLVSPVRWCESIRYLIDRGVGRFIEIGHEQTLSKFGFFIDRSRQHLPWQKLRVA